MPAPRWTTLWKGWKNMKNIYIRLLQFLVGTEIDGDWGPLSCAAADRLISQLREVAVHVFEITREEVPEDGVDSSV